MTFLSDYSKLNDIYTFSKPKERKKKTLQEAQSIGKMYSSIVSRYLDGIKGQIRSLVINSGGKDLNVGKIIQPALKVLWYEGLHEGLFYDKSQHNFSFVSDVANFAQIDLAGKNTPVESGKNTPVERQKLSKEQEKIIVNEYLASPGQYNQSQVDHIYALVSGSNKSIIAREAAKYNNLPTPIVNKLKKERQKLKGDLKLGTLTKEEREELRWLNNLPKEQRDLLELQSVGQDTLLARAITKQNKQKEKITRLKTVSTTLKSQGQKLASTDVPTPKNSSSAKKSRKQEAKRLVDLQRQRIKLKEELKTNVLTKEERAELDWLKQLPEDQRKLLELQSAGQDTPLSKALTKYTQQRIRIDKLKEIGSELKSKGISLKPPIKEKTLLEEFLSIPSDEGKQRYYDELTIEQKKVIRQYVLDNTDSGTLLNIRNYDVRGRQLKGAEYRKLKSFQVEPENLAAATRAASIKKKQQVGALSRVLTEEKIESRSRSAISPSRNRTEQEVNTILDNPELTRKEKKRALNRLISPDYAKGFGIRGDREALIDKIHQERLSTQVKFPTKKIQSEVKGFLRRKTPGRETLSKEGNLALAYDVDVRERLRDIETYYPYIASTEERESYVQAYIDARTLELSNYYTEEFKNSIKAQVAEITKGKDSKLAKGRLTELFKEIETGISKEETARNKKLYDNFNNAFSSAQYTDKKSNQKEINNLRRLWGSQVARSYRRVANKYDEDSRLKQIISILEDFQGINRNTPLTRESAEKKLAELNYPFPENVVRELRKLKASVLSDRDAKKLELQLERMQEDYPQLEETDVSLDKRSFEYQVLRNYQSKKTTINVKDLPESIINDLQQRGLIKPGQKTISQSKKLQILETLREPTNYGGINPLIAEQHKSLVQARKLSAQEAKKNKEAPGTYISKYYAQIHSEKLGRALTKDDYPPDNIDNLIINPYQRLERILNNELATSYNLGRMEAFIRNGVSQVRWISVLDSNTSTFCTSLNNRIFNISEIQAFSAGRGLVYDYFPNTRKTFDEVKRNSAIGVFYMPSVHPYCRSYLEPVPPQEELQTEKKNYFSAYQQALSEQLASAKITPESLVNNERILQAMVVMGAVALNIKARSDRKKKEEERKKLMVTAGAVAVAGLGAYAMARSRVGKELYDNALENLSKGKRVQPESEVIENFIDATSRSIDDAVEQVTDTRVPLALPPAPQPKGLLSEQALPDLSSLERTAVTVELPSFDTPSPLLKVLEEVVTDLRDDVPIPTAISDLRGGTIIPKEQLKLIDDMMMRMRGQPENPDAIKRMEQAPSFIKKVEVYIESTTGKKPRYKGGLDDLVLIQDLISINDRTSKDIVTALIRSQTRDIGNLEENIDLLLSKSFKGRLPNTNKITKVQLINAEQRLYLVKQRKGESSIITSDLDPTVYSSYVKELQARKEQLSKNLRRAKTPKKQQELQAAISDYQKAIDRLSNLFGNKGRPVSKSEAAKIKAQFSSKLALYDELSRLDLRITTKERVENGIVVAPSREIQVDATKVIGNAGQRARSFISLVKELDKPNPLMQRLKEEYVRFFFRDEQIKGLSLRYRGAIREDLNNFIQRPDLDTSAINTKIEELRYMRTYISSQITDKGNAVLRDYDIFTIGLTNETKIVRKPSVIEQEKKFFTDNVNLYISDIRNDIDKQIKLLEDLL